MKTKVEKSFSNDNMDEMLDNREDNIKEELPEKLDDLPEEYEKTYNEDRKVDLLIQVEDIYQALFNKIPKDSEKELIRDSFLTFSK